MTKEAILKKLHEIGFRPFEHLRKESRDGKNRWVWNRPVENQNDWFMVWIIEEGENLYIEKVKNCADKTFDKSDIPELIKYIKIKFNAPYTET